MSRLRVVASGATLITLSALLWATPPAQAAVAAAPAVPCVEPTNRTVPPDWRELEEPPVTQADLAALPASDTTRKAVAREVAGTLASTITIPTVVHVIRGKHRRDRPRMNRPKIQRLIAILNKGMAGGQNPASAATRYRFKLRNVTYTRRDGWYHAYFFGPRDRRMKRALHRGNARTLNLYINGGGPKGQPVLGWSRFPWQRAAAPKLDSVTVNVAGLPGGRAKGYNLGDTVIHEVGHWLGLLHPFQGGCEGPGDQVSDTPAEAEPSYYCQTTRDTCPDDPGFDPVNNFMDYSLDACMNMLTAGQVRRADVAWSRWRQNR